MRIMRRNKIGATGFGVLTLCLVLVSAFCITGTVMSQNDLNSQELESYYRGLERELVRETREYLGQEGFQNSGVTITRVIDTDGIREYTVTVHHGKINEMSEDARESLKEELAKLTFMAENCIFCHEFLETD